MLWMPSLAEPAGVRACFRSSRVRRWQRPRRSSSASGSGADSAQRSRSCQRPRPGSTRVRGLTCLRPFRLSLERRLPIDRRRGSSARRVGRVGVLCGDGLTGPCGHCSRADPGPTGVQPRRPAHAAARLHAPRDQLHHRPPRSRGFRHRAQPAHPALRRPPAGHRADPPRSGRASRTSQSRTPFAASAGTRKGEDRTELRDGRPRGAPSGRGASRRGILWNPETPNGAAPDAPLTHTNPTPHQNR